MTVIRALFCLLAAAFLAAGCGGGGLPFDSLHIAPGPFTAIPGDRVRFHAFGQYASGDPGQEITALARWESTDTTVGVVDAAGVFTAVGPGTCVISAAYGSLGPVSSEVTVEPLPAQPARDWCPLGFGYRWMYTGSEVTPGQARTRQTVTLTIGIDQQVVEDGRVWWELSVKGTDPGEPPGYVHWRHTAEGLLVRVRGLLPIYRLKAPLEPGATWEDDNSNLHTFAIVSTTESVTVPAGTFSNCLKVVEHEARAYQPFDIIAWFAPGVGLVKQEVRINGELYQYQDLVQYRF